MLRITMSVSGEGATKYFDAAPAASKYYGSERGQQGGELNVWGRRAMLAARNSIPLASDKPISGQEQGNRRNVDCANEDDTQTEGDCLQVKLEECLRYRVCSRPAEPGVEPTSQRIIVSGILTTFSSKPFQGYSKPLSSSVLRAACRSARVLCGTLHVRARRRLLPSGPWTAADWKQLVREP